MDRRWLDGGPEALRWERGRGTAKRVVSAELGEMPLPTKAHVRTSWAPSCMTEFCYSVTGHLSLSLLLRVRQKTCADPPHVTPTTYTRHQCCSHREDKGSMKLWPRGTIIGEWRFWFTGSAQTHHIQYISMTWQFPKFTTTGDNTGVCAC